MILESDAFRDGEPIPRRFTCDGADVSPPLSWRDAPADTAAFALFMDDPDAPAGTWVHWVLFNVPASETGVEEGASARSLPRGAAQGTNSWGRRDYGGPAHRAARTATSSGCTPSTRRSTSVGMRQRRR